jgi:hypothetical protein
MAQIEYLSPGALKPTRRNARTHSRKQIRQIAASIERFGFTSPVLIDEGAVILAGHGRLEAAKLLAMPSVPCMRIENMSEADKRAYALADNKLALNAGWDDELLAIELQDLMAADLGFDVGITGFSIAEVDRLIDGLAPVEDGDPTLDALPDPRLVPARCRPGDVWQLGAHRLICGDARDRQTVHDLMDGELAEMAFTDPPYNVAIAGNVGGLGKIRHRNFVMASGEMDRQQFTAFLSASFANLAAFSIDGSIHFVCMDWRHLQEVTDAGCANFTELKNLIVWSKDNGAMGTFYRSRHELIFAFKNGTAPHINTFELGQHGRYRTNVWDVPRREHAESWPPGRTRASSDRQAGSDDRGCDQGCVASRRHRSRPVWRLRLNIDRGTHDRPTSAPLRTMIRSTAIGSSSAGRHSPKDDAEQIACGLGAASRLEVAA